VCETKIVHDDQAVFKRDYVCSDQIWHTALHSETIRRHVTRSRPGAVYVLYFNSGLTHWLFNVIAYKTLLTAVVWMSTTNTKHYTYRFYHAVPSHSLTTHHHRLPVPLSSMMSCRACVTCWVTSLRRTDSSLAVTSTVSVIVGRRTPVIQAVLDTHGLHQFVMSSTRSTTDVCNLLDLPWWSADLVPPASLALPFNCLTVPLIMTSSHGRVSTRVKPKRYLISYIYRSLKYMNRTDFFLSFAALRWNSQGRWRLHRPTGFGHHGHSRTSLPVEAFRVFTPW